MAGAWTTRACRRSIFSLPADPDTAVAALLAAIGIPTGAAGARYGEPRPLHQPKGGEQGRHALGIEDLAHALRGAVGGRDVTLTHLPLSWQGSFWHFRHPLDFLGSDGGGGVGGGPGISVGAALALKGSGRLPIGICGDGDFLMTATALWTAVHYRIPLLIVVANNRSFYNDEVHQERMAIMRNRPVDNKWIGQKMLDPEIDLAALARAQGARGFGPVAKSEELGGGARPRRSRRSRPATSRWSTCASNRDTAPAKPPAQWWRGNRGSA